MVVAGVDRQHTGHIGHIGEVQGRAKAGLGHSGVHGIASGNGVSPVVCAGNAEIVGAEAEVGILATGPRAGGGEDEGGVGDGVAVAIADLQGECLTEAAIHRCDLVIAIQNNEAMGRIG